MQEVPPQQSSLQEAFSFLAIKTNIFFTFLDISQLEHCINPEGWAGKLLEIFSSLFLQIKGGNRAVTTPYWISPVPKLASCILSSAFFESICGFLGIFLMEITGGGSKMCCHHKLPCFH